MKLLATAAIVGLMATPVLADDQADNLPYFTAVVTTYDARCQVLQPNVIEAAIKLASTTPKLAEYTKAAKDVDTAFKKEGKEGWCSLAQGIVSQLSLTLLKSAK